MKYSLSLSYPLHIYLKDGVNADKKICEVLKKRQYDSGAGFGSRDMTFYYRSQKAVKQAARLVKGLSVVYNVSWEKME